MKINGKWVFIDNHTIDNLEKMYEWSNDKELIEIECGKNNKILSIDDYKNNAMTSYIENNHESNSTFCHFGIYRNFNNELIGYVDFQNISENSSELSLSIPDKENRNKHFGMDAVIIALNYAFKIRNIKNIIMRTRIDNAVVKNICKKVGIKYEIEHFTENNYDIDLVRYEINESIFEGITSRLFDIK